MKVSTWLRRLLCNHDWGTSAKLCENGMPASFSLTIAAVETRRAGVLETARTITNYTANLCCVKCEKTKTKKMTPVNTEQLCNYAEHKLKDVAGTIFGKFGIPQEKRNGAGKNESR